MKTIYQLLYHRICCGHQPALTHGSPPSRRNWLFRWLSGRKNELNVVFSHDNLEICTVPILIWYWLHSNFVFVDVGRCGHPWVKIFHCIMHFFPRAENLHGNRYFRILRRDLRLIIKLKKPGVIRERTKSVESRTRWWQQHRRIDTQKCARFREISSWKMSSDDRKRNRNQE